MKNIFRSTGLRDMSIGKKLVFSGYMFIVPIIICISIVTSVYDYRESTIYRKEKCLQSVQGISSSIWLLQREMEDICIYISINTDIKSLLSSSEASEINKNSQLWTEEAPMKMVEDMIALKSHINTIAIYPENGVRPYLKCVDASSHITTFSELKESLLYKNAINRMGKPGWISTGKYDNMLYQLNRKEKIVIYREIYNLAKDHRLAFLAIGADKEYFEDICGRNINKEEEGLVVLNKDGNILLETGIIPDKVKRFIEAKGNSLENNGVYNYSGSQIFMAEDKGVYVCLVEPEITMRDVFSNILLDQALLLAGLMAGLFPVMILLARVVTVPIARLKRGMDLFKKGDFNQKIKIDAYDEVGQLTECFNDMVDEIKELVNKNYIMVLKEKESELIALQAQINPHFLYNALDVLYWEAQNSDNEELSEDILALSNLFRMVLGQGKGIISIEEEVGLVKEYLHVQKMRFGKKMDYEIRVAADIGKIEIPKLVLQPFVENAIVHGLEKQEKNCKIKVTGYKEGNYICFVVSDTGAGMTKSQAESIFKEDTQKRYSGQRVGRYAIKNIKERLELRYKDDFVLEIKSQPGKGTDVVIKIPYDGGN